MRCSEPVSSHLSECLFLSLTCHITAPHSYKLSTYAQKVYIRMHAGVSQHLIGALESDGEGGTHTMLRALCMDTDRKEDCDKRARRIIFSYFAACFAA